MCMACTPVCVGFFDVCCNSGIVLSSCGPASNYSVNVLGGVGLCDVIPVVPSGMLVACTDEAIVVFSEACEGE